MPDDNRYDKNQKAANDYAQTASSAANRVAAEYNSDVYLYSGAIFDDGYAELVQAFSQRPCDSAILILVTNGGSANSAYRIARMFQKTYKKFYLCAPSYCKSAGTIIAIGAHSLIMDNFSELGPLDIQLHRQDELFDVRSGLITRSAFKSLTEASSDMYQEIMLRIKFASRNRVSFKLASDIALTLSGQLISPISSQLNPESIGSDFRDLKVALEYGKRLAAHSKNAKPYSVEKLVNEYPSHNFIIDDDEARTLFHNVDPPKASLYELIECIGDAAYDEASTPIVRILGELNEQQDKRDSEYIAETESEHGKDAEKTAGVDRS